MTDISRFQTNNQAPKQDRILTTTSSGFMELQEHQTVSVRSLQQLSCTVTLIMQLNYSFVH